MLYIKALKLINMLSRQVEVSNKIRLKHENKFFILKIIRLFDLIRRDDWSIKSIFKKKCWLQNLKKASLFV